MPSSTIRRVQTTVTGVAGTPYYIVGHFDAAVGTVEQCIAQWHLFITGVLDGPASGFPTGTQIRTEGEVQLLNPVDGAVIGTEITTAALSTGANPGPMLPPATQLLVRWRTGQYVNRREVRGRTNLPCALEEASTTRGEVETSVVIGLNERAAALKNDSNTEFVIWSKLNGVWFPVSSVSTWNRFSVLRSRRD